MKVLPYIRFLMVALLIMVYVDNVRFRSGDGVIETSFIIFNFITGSLLLLFLVYLIYEGYYELRGRIWKIKLVRYYAVLCECLVLIDSLFVFLYHEDSFQEVVFALIGFAAALYLVIYEIRIIKGNASEQSASR